MRDELKRRQVILFSGWAFALVVIGIRYAEPVLDGDVFFHMAYAKQMLARGTLILDHTTFSWTPASNAMIYCAWASELLLYALWEHAGSWSVFALRYLVIGATLALAATYAWRTGLGRSLVVPALLLLVMLSSPAGLQIKPELFSLLFFHTVVWAWFSAKRDALDGRLPAGRFYLVPAVVLIWVNTHGGFVLVAPFLLAVAVGEFINVRVSPVIALPGRARAHLVAAWALCVAAVFVTPYGYHYPVQLVQDLLLGATPRPDAVWNAAHRGVFNPVALKLHMVEYGVILAALLVFVATVNRRARQGGGADWAVVLANLTCLAFFLGPLRTTYLWPVVAAYSAMYLLRNDRDESAVEESLSRSSAGQAFVGVAVGLMLFAGVRAVFEARYRPFDRSWIGFGISDTNPVDEAEFLARAQLGPRLYNVFDSGGYLLWRLDPQYTVMTDQRSFPYLAWFDDQYRFTTGEIFDTFLKKYPADVAVIDLDKRGTIENFLSSADWEWIYYGRAAAVFVRTGTTVPSAALAVAPDRFTKIRNPATADRVAWFAARVGDTATAATARAKRASW